jgi:1,4-alpha-glucan branching enzyme
MVSRPTWLGGLGFGFKWDMGWMHDTLSYLQHDPVHRAFHHGAITFRGMYAWHENFVLPLSHDEVVHGKGSLLGRMPGSAQQCFANLRLLLAMQWSQPGKKLLFMGGEFGQSAEWNHDRSLDWHLTASAPHAQIQRLVGDLNRLYRTVPAMHADAVAEGFEWIDPNDSTQSCFVFLRQHAGDCVVVVLNCTPIVRTNYRVGVPKGGTWREVLNTDAAIYGGGGRGNLGAIEAGPFACHGRPFVLHLLLPPLSALWLRHEPPAELPTQVDEQHAANQPAAAPRQPPRGPAGPAPPP